VRQPWLADIPDRERRDGFPQLVIRGKHPVIPMPMLPRRRYEIGEPVQKLKRRELDDAVRSRPRGLAAAAGADPVGRFVSGQHVTDARDPTGVRSFIAGLDRYRPALGKLAGRMDGAEDVLRVIGRRLRGVAIDRAWADAA